VTRLEKALKSGVLPEELQDKKPAAAKADDKMDVEAEKKAEDKTEPTTKAADAAGKEAEKKDAGAAMEVEDDEDLE